MASKKQLQVTLVRSINKALPNHKACVKGLGLRRMRHTVTVENTACTQGMIRKVIHLVSVKEV